LAASSPISTSRLMAFEKSGQRGGAAGARRGMALALPSGHQMHELGSIDVMHIDQTLGLSRHVACASG